MGQTELPICLYNSISDNFGKIYEFGNPCNNNVSLEVNFLILFVSFSNIIRTLCPPCPILAVNVGQTFFHILSNIMPLDY